MQEYRTGEKPGSGTYYCTNCGQELNLGESDKMPPCPRCNNTEFTEKDIHDKKNG